MRFNKWIVLMLLGGFLMAAAGVLRAQSLGEIARKERQNKANQPKATKVYTNDDIPRATMIGTSSETGSAEAAAKAPESGETASSGAGAAEGKQAEAAGPGDKKTKEYWQAEYKKAKDNLDLAQEQSSLADDELSLAKANQVREADATKKADYDQQIATLRDTAGNKHAAVDKAKQAMDDLKKEFDDSGAPADWWPAAEQKQ